MKQPGNCSVSTKKYRTGDNIWYFIAMVLLGTPAHVYPWCFTGIFFHFHHTFASVVVGLRYRLSMSNLRSRKNKTPEVIISKGFVSLNGKQFELYSKVRNVRSVVFQPHQQPPILEFTIEWKTSKGVTFDELRCLFLRAWKTRPDRWKRPSKSSDMKQLLFIFLLTVISAAQAQVTPDMMAYDKGYEEVVRKMASVSAMWWWIQLMRSSFREIRCSPPGITTKASGSKTSSGSPLWRMVLLSMSIIMMMKVI